MNLSVDDFDVSKQYLNGKVSIKVHTPPPRRRIVRWNSKFFNIFYTFISLATIRCTYIICLSITRAIRSRTRQPSRECILPRTHTPTIGVRFPVIRHVCTLRVGQGKTYATECVARTYFFFPPAIVFTAIRDSTPHVHTHTYLSIV